ncbi:hypothetical protein PRK78_001652 [Emydomyces testavorans]|uniref:Uncharacterized protein n=1 Tax=Emydomyces testavorans TaxID=2070801 RepID=A0AAF0IFQ7_9EURO|nr:hypothetical protein PRK78_001652 [Emydomyces testavorans]
MVRSILSLIPYQLPYSTFTLGPNPDIQRPRQNVPPAGAAPNCDCLSGGAIAGIVLGSIAGFFLLYWLIKLAYEASSSNVSETITYRGGSSRHGHPHRRKRRSSSYIEKGSPISTRRYRREVIERPAKVYVS